MVQLSPNSPLWLWSKSFLALWPSILLHLCGFLSCLVQRVSAAINMLLILTARLVGDVW